MFCSAQQFQVSRAFLLQQAAWLYERELSQVRAQMRKGMGGAAAPPVSNTSTLSGTASNASPRPMSPAPMAMGMAGGTRMVRTGSGGSYGISRPLAPSNSGQDPLTQSLQLG